MIIVLEGPDGAGKSTLAKILIKNLTSIGEAVRLLKCGPIQLDPFLEYLRPLDDLVRAPGKTYIFDRWHVGELIYGPLLRERSMLTTFQANYIEMVLQTFGCHFVHMTQLVEKLEGRWDIRPDNLIKREWLADISTKYHDYVKDKPHWNTTYREWTDVVSFDMKFPSPRLGSYIGPHRPAVLLLGDIRNKDTYTWPFVPATNTSGHWMMNAFEQAGVDHMKLGIININEIETHDARTLWYQLGEPPVVALGDSALRAWRRTELPLTTKIAHPQYMRRFRNISFERYGQLVKDVMNK